MKEKNFNLLILPSVSNMQQVVDRFSFPINLTKGHFKDLEIIFRGGGVTVLYKGADLKDFSFVWLSSSWGSRDLAFAVQLYLEKNSIPHTHVEKGTSKLTDHMFFSLNGIPTSDMLFLGHKDVEKTLEKIKTVCGYPLVIKDIKGSRGAHSVKIVTENELVEKMAELPRHKKYLFQKYIPNEYDWGVMVANGVVVSGERSYPCVGEFRNNVCNGAREIFVDPADIPEHIKRIAIDASRTLGLDWSRADIIVDRDNQTPYVLEVNRFPGITAKTSEVEGAYKFLASQIEPLLGVKGEKRASPIDKK